jgi:iron complex transport system substrate-binding protein
MRNRLLLAAMLSAIFVGSFLAQQLPGRGELREPRDRQINRIVSMAPSITETLYALGLGDRVVGVTRYCRYPPEVQEVAKVGGYHNPNFEAVVALDPDLVVLLSGDEPSRSAFGKLGIRTLVVCHNNVEGILDSFLQIGRIGRAEADARRMIEDTRARMERVRQKTAGLPRPKVLFAIDRSTRPDKLEDVYVAGSDGFFDSIITLAGGQNAYPQTSVRFPVVSAEGILWMNPDVILDLSFAVAQGQQDREKTLAAWQQVDEVQAVKSGRVHALDQDYALVHGPRFVLLIEDLTRLIHPEIDWQ